MLALRWGVLGLVVLTAGPIGAGADSPGDYQTRDGKLIRILEIDDLQGGALGFAGQRWSIEPSGAWQVGRVSKGTFKAERSGTLSARQIEMLVRDLARYKLKTLKSAREMKRVPNPRLIVIRFGKQRAELVLPPTAALPKTNPRTIPGRFAGIVKAVDKLLVASKPGD